jgi:hypothetical protein
MSRDRYEELLNELEAAHEVGDLQLIAELEFEMEEEDELSL